MTESVNNTNFDSIAPIYDGLSRLVFGNALQRAQTEHISLIPPNSNVLLIGGGSGWLLEQLLTYSPLAEVTYLEVSPKMLQLAQLRMSKQDSTSPQIAFRLGDENSLQP